MLPLQAGLERQLQAHPDATLQEHCEQWRAQTGTPVSISRMSRAILLLKWTRKKKSLQASERREQERQEWREQAKKLDVSKLVFLDETGSNVALTRLFARAPKGKRATGSIPRHRGKNLTMISVLTLRGLGESLIIEGAANSALFEGYLEDMLLPNLQTGQIVIMDNLKIHLGMNVRSLIEAHGCQLRFLPAYSPDFSPIEEAFSKIKTLLRGIGARTRETLQQALEYAITTVTASDASGCFTHCGYALPNRSSSLPARQAQSS
jgi:transposase